jgi:hypothetical protein
MVKECREGKWKEKGAERKECLKEMEPVYMRLSFIGIDPERARITGLRRRETYRSGVEEA